MISPCQVLSLAWRLWQGHQAAQLPPRTPPGGESTAF